MTHRPWGTALLVLAACVAAPLGRAHAQAADGFDLSRLEFPPGFLDLSDIVVSAASDGSTTMTARTTLLNSSTLVLFTSMDRPGVGRARILGLKPQDWSLTKSIPALANPVLDNLTLSNVALVLSDVDIRLNSGDIPDEQRAFYSEVYQADEFTLVLKPGINLIAAIPVDELEPGHPLLFIMDALGIERGVVLLQGTLGKSLMLLGGGGGGGSVIKDLYLRAELPPMRPPNSPAWFRSGQLALELTGDPTVRLVGEMNVIIDETDLQFFLSAMLARTGVSLAGGMKAEEPWVAPFGIGWLTLNQVILKIGFTPDGSLVLGFAGAAVFGEKDIDVAIGIAVNVFTGVPTNFIMRGESEAGVALSDLAKVQAGMAAAAERAAGVAGVDPATAEPILPLDALPDIQLRDLGMSFALRPDYDLGIEAGMSLKGQLWLETGPGGQMEHFAGVDVGVTTDGIWFKGTLGAFKLGPLIWDDAVLDLALTREEQHFIVKGQVQIGQTRQLVDLSISREALRFRTETELFGLFSADLSAQSVFNLRNPTFQVDAVVHNDFGQFIQPVMANAIVTFAGAGRVLLAGAQVASRAARSALDMNEATEAQLRARLEEIRDRADQSYRAAQADAAAALAVARAAYRSMNSARSRWEGTSRRQVSLRAQRYTDYVRARGVHAARSAGYAALRAVAEGRRAIRDAMPPVEQDILMRGVQAALAAVRARLAEIEQNLAVLAARYERVIAAVDAGATPFTVEHAEFHGALAAVQGGGSVSWKITGVFLGEPYDVARSLDFRSPGEAAAELLLGLVNQ